jgi:hypothetical protein
MPRDDPFLVFHPKTVKGIDGAGLVFLGKLIPHSVHNKVRGSMVIHGSDSVYPSTQVNLISTTPGQRVL